MITDRILKVLRSRSTLDQPMGHAALREAVKPVVGIDGPNWFDLAMQSLVETGQVDVTWSRVGSGKRQAEYVATRQRATQTETLIRDHND